MDVNGLLNVYNTINVATTKKIGFNAALNTSLRESSAGVLSLQLAGTDVLTFNPTGIIFNSGQNITLASTQKLVLDSANNNFILSPSSTTIDVRTGNTTRATFGNSGNTFYGNATFDTTTLFVDSVNHRVGFGTITPGYFADIRSGSGVSQLHISRNSSDVGGWITSANNDSAVALSGGTAYNGTNWVAKATSASLLDIINGAFNFYNDSGLVVGNTFSPTIRLSLATNGDIVTTGNLFVPQNKIIYLDSGTNTKTISYSSGTSTISIYNTASGSIDIRTTNIAFGSFTRIPGTNSPLSQTVCHWNTASAWIFYNGITNTLTASFGVSSVTKTGTGLYRVNFINSFTAAANSMGIGSVQNSSSLFVCIDKSGGSASYLDVVVRDNAGTLTDAVIGVAFYGFQ